MNISPIQNGVIEDYFENGFSYAGLAQKYGRDCSSCRKTISAYKMQYRADNGADRVRKIIPTNSKGTTTGKPLSLGHSAIGVRVGRYMQRHKISATAFGMLMQPMKSPSNVNLAVIGAYDWTLSDLQALSLFFDVPFDRLMLMEAEHAFA
jgi:hypothetical protein